MDKAAAVLEIKEMLKSEGKEELMEFAEDLAGIGYKAVKIVIKHTDTKMDDVAISALDGVITDFIDGIDGEEG